MCRFIKKSQLLLIFSFVNFCLLNSISAQKKIPAFKVIAFYTAKNDLAHISFVNEANKWFPTMAAKYNFSYDATNNWNNLNLQFLSQYQIVIFIDSRPDSIEQRNAFEAYMKNGGGWMGFHFAGFGLNNSLYPQNWDWYHNKFLGSGSYVSNTWRPVSAFLKVEDKKHFATKNLGIKFKSSPSEWYRWSNDLRNNPDIKILLSIDSSSFPLGTGPKLHEIWHSGYYPVAWTNKNYKMVYINMGHNDIDYENKTNKELSFTFNNTIQDLFIINCLLWMSSSKK